MHGPGIYGDGVPREPGEPAMTSWNRTEYDGPSRRLPPRRHADLSVLLRLDIPERVRGPGRATERLSVTSKRDVEDGPGRLSPLTRVDWSATLRSRQ